MAAFAESLPFLTEAKDTLRDGLGTLRADAERSHPLEQTVQQGAQEGQASNLRTLRGLYGSALPARLQIERQILSKTQRLPSIRSSCLGLQALTGELDEFSFESYLAPPAESECGSVDMHSQMEAKLRMNTKPSRRPMP